MQHIIEKKARKRKEKEKPRKWSHEKQRTTQDKNSCDVTKKKKIKKTSPHSPSYHLNS
jgi:hypothetical protein